MDRVVNFVNGVISNITGKTEVGNEDLFGYLNKFAAKFSGGKFAKKFLSYIKIYVIAIVVMTTIGPITELVFMTIVGLVKVLKFIGIISAVVFIGFVLFHVKQAIVGEKDSIEDLEEEK